MGVFKRSLKYGTALGVTYLSVEQRLWSQLSHKEIQDKLATVTQYGQQAERYVARQTGVDVTKWSPTATLQSYDLQTLWNRSVKSSFKTLAGVRANDLIAKVQKMLDTTSTAGSGGNKK